MSPAYVAWLNIDRFMTAEGRTHTRSRRPVCVLFMTSSAYRRFVPSPPAWGITVVKEILGRWLKEASVATGSFSQVDDSYLNIIINHKSVSVAFIWDSEQFPVSFIIKSTRMMDWVKIRSRFRGLVLVLVWDAAVIYCHLVAECRYCTFNIKTWQLSFLQIIIEFSFTHELI